MTYSEVNPTLDKAVYEVFEKEHSVHYFSMSEDTKKLLSKTDFKNNVVKLPFPRIKLNIMWENNEGDKYPYIYVIDEEDFIFVGYVRQTIRHYTEPELGLLELNKDLSYRKEGIQDGLTMDNINGKDISNLPHNEKVELAKIYFDKFRSGYETEVKLNNKSEKLMIKFVGNFINLINSRDVELITVEKSEEQNAKRIRRGKLPIPPITHIRLIGKIKEYVNKLSSTGYIEYSHSFWVRGHWRTLRDENRYKAKVGTMVWIVPYIKGKGHLIEKKYYMDVTTKKEVKNGNSSNT